jgi:hypothetical protein
MLVAGAALAAVVSLQMLYWHSRTGSWIINAFALNNEGFNWLSPHLMDFLFSIRKGLFVWAPCLLLIIPGAILLLRRDLILGAAISIILLLHTYINAGWWNWWFGASYGSRTFVDVMPLAAIPLAASMSFVSGRIAHGIAITLVVLFVTLNMFLTVSYWERFVPVDETTVGDLVALPSRWLRFVFALHQS